MIESEPQRDQAANRESADDIAPAVPAKAEDRSRFSREGQIPAVGETADREAAAPAPSASEQAYEAGPSADAPAASVVSFLAQRSGRDWAVRVAAHGPPNQRFSLLGVLARFKSDLAPHRAQFEALLSRIFWATPDTETDLLRATLGARFGLRSVDDPSGFRQIPGSRPDAFSPDDLRRMWRALERLPEQHVESSPSFRHLVADDVMNNEDAEGHYIGRALLDNPTVRTNLARLSEAQRAAVHKQVDPVMGTVAMTHGLDETRQYFDNTPDRLAELRSKVGLRQLTEEQYRFAENEMNAARAEGVTGRFEHMFRHEIGHAVDEQLGASSSYCRTAAGGGWRVFNDEEDLIQTLLNDTGLASSSSDVLAYIRRQVADTLRPRPPGTPSEAEPSLTAQQRQAMQRITGMVSWGKDALPGQTPAMDIGGRVYTLHGLMGWHSYDRNARERQVSNYQFQAPQEWFAEAYAAYYDPASTTPGDRLIQAGDTATKQYFDSAVHPFVARRERKAEGEYTQRG
jgi:hypothetical protein